MAGPLSSFFESYQEVPKGSLSDIFEEEPVPLDVFIQDSKFLGQKGVNLSDRQSDAIRHIERIYYPDLYPLMREGFDDGEYWSDDIALRNIITLQWGKGSGKDMVCRWASLRVAYLLLCLRSPQEYYGMPEIDSIHLLNIAANSQQANRAFFDPMTKAVKQGWFRDKAQPKQGLIQYDKNIEAVSGHSDAEGQEGLNLMLGVADEIDAFKAKDEMVGQGKRAREASTSAESILEMLKTSASTRFPDTYKRVAISYPRYLGSTIQKETEKGKASLEKYGQKSIHFVSGPWATWEVNPRIKGKDNFQEDYDTDPAAAAAKYECKPSRSSDAYFRNMDAFQNAVDNEVQPLTIDYRLGEVRSAYTDEVTKVWEPVFNFADDFKPKQGARYAMHGDMAITGDRAGIAMSHVERWEDRVVTLEAEDGEIVTSSQVVPVIKNDFTIAFEASLAAKPMPREIQVRWARMLAYELIKRGFPVVRFTFDQFQSADSMQILESHGIETERVSADINDNVYKALKDVVYDGRLHMPFDQLLFIELESLSRVNGKVDHPPGGSKDKADALACSVVGALVSGGEEDENGSIVSIGGDSITVGEPLTMLDGFGFTNSGMGMPIGMKGVGLNGW